jgi:LmbE family N-acetylglucosaminyl deacetylase
VTRVLAVGSDVATLVAVAGGTLAKFVDGGAETFVSEIGPADGASQDGRDSRGSVTASTLGVTWLGTAWVDGHDDGRALRDPVMDVIRQAKPDVLLVSSIGTQGLVAHSETAFNAAYCSIIPNYSSPQGLDPASVRAPILLVDDPESPTYQPDQYVDISEQWAQKQEALEAAGVMEGSPLRHLAETSSRARGIQVQVDFAEAFTFERAWGRLRPHRVLP